MAGSWRRLRTLFTRGRLAGDLDEEIRAHEAELRASLEAEGRGPAEAARLARLRLGGRLQIREAAADEWRLGWLEGTADDLRLAVRSLGRRPGFAAAAIATLALGIGASTAIFSVAYGVSLRPLPYPAADRLVRIYESNPATQQFEQDVSPGAYQAWREGAASLASTAFYSKRALRTVAGPEGVRLRTMRVSPDFFGVLGIRLSLGPGFKPERDYNRMTTRDAVLSYDVWQQLFGGRADVIGSPLVFVGVTGDDPLRVVGVLPADFSFSEPVDVWMPQVWEVPIAPLLYNLRYDRVVARLAPGATIEQARAELEAAAARLSREHPASNGGWTVTVESLHSSVVGDFGRATWLLVAAVLVVLLTASVNVGGLLTARAVTRERETAVRAALGAGAWRLVRLELVESAVTCLAGATLGLLVAWLGVAALRAAAPPGIPRLDAIAFDWPTLLVAGAAALVALAVFTIASSGRRSRVELSVGLREGTAGSGQRPGRRRAQATLTVAQSAGAATLVVLAVVFTRSLQNLTTLDLGWEPTSTWVIPATPHLQGIRRPWYARVEWSDRLIDRIEALPGVAGAAITTQVPLGPSAYGSTLARGRGKDAGDDARWPGVQHQVSDRFFDVMGIRLVEGRPFGSGDRFSEAAMTDSDSRPESGSVIVTRATANALWPGESAIGQAVWLPDIDNVAWRTVVGVAGDIQFAAVGELPRLHVFLPWTQESGGDIHVVVKLADAATGVPAVREVLRSVEPGAVADEILSLEALVDRATAQPRFTSRLVTAFGGLALALAAVGIYGTLAYLVGRQRRQFGIHLALGATRAAVFWQVLRLGLTPALAGGLIGLSLALLITRAFRSLLFEVAPLDPTSLAAGGILLAGVAIAAATGPARRASRTNPAAALRAE